MSIGIPSLHVLVALQGTPLLPVHDPESEPFDGDSLHLLCDVHGLELHPLHPTRELDDGVPWPDELPEPNVCPFEVPTPDDQHPLVREGSLVPAIDVDDEGDDGENQENKANKGGGNVLPNRLGVLMEDCEVTQIYHSINYWVDGMGSSES